MMHRVSLGSWTPRPGLSHIQHQIEIPLEVSFRNPRASGYLEILVLALSLQSLRTVRWSLHPWTVHAEPASSEKLLAAGRLFLNKGMEGSCMRTVLYDPRKQGPKH